MEHFSNELDVFGKNGCRKSCKRERERTTGYFKKNIQLMLTDNFRERIFIACSNNDNLDGEQSVKEVGLGWKRGFSFRRRP